MHISISGQGVELNDTVRDHLDRRMQFALSRFAHRVERVLVRLEDLNGPKGGVDKLCRLHVNIKGMAPVIVAHSAASVPEAVNLSSQRLRRTLVRKLDRWVKGRTLSNTDLSRLRG